MNNINYSSRCVNNGMNGKNINHYKEKVSKFKRNKNKKIESNDELKELNKEKRKETRKEKKKYLWEYKKRHPCKCGEKHPACLVFHHRDKTRKDTEVASLLSSSWKKLKDEISKCDVVCENCHKKIHYEELNGK